MPGDVFGGWGKHVGNGVDDNGISIRVIRGFGIACVENDWLTIAYATVQTNIAVFIASEVEILIDFEFHVLLADPLDDLTCGENSTDGQS